MKSHNASEQISLVTKVSELEAYTMNLHNEVDTLVTSKKTEISQKLNELSAYKLSTSKMFEQVDEIRVHFESLVTLLACLTEQSSIVMNLVRQPKLK